MNPIAEEIMSIVNSSDEESLQHYGMPRRSGRYPWGSGDNGYQRTGDFLSRVDELKKAGLSETEIAKSMGLTTTQLRTQKALAKDERRRLDVARAKNRMECHALTTAGSFSSWQRLISRLILQGEVTPLVPASILQLMPTMVYVSEGIAQPIECMETVGY